LGGPGAGLRRKLEFATLVSYINRVDSGQIRSARANIQTLQMFSAALGFPRSHRTSVLPLP
jgi:hypothetical protein